MPMDLLGIYSWVYVPLTENLSLNQAAIHMSTKDENDASRAVDGSWKNYVSQGSCSVTGDANQPWWSVNIGHRILVSSVIIANRVDFGE